jgi:hypothetical protein
MSKATHQTWSWFGTVNEPAGAIDDEFTPPCGRSRTIPTFVRCALAASAASGATAGGQAGRPLTGVRGLQPIITGGVPHISRMRAFLGMTRSSLQIKPSNDPAVQETSSPLRDMQAVTTL